jgi:hypothetical protein
MLFIDAKPGKMFTISGKIHWSDLKFPNGFNVKTDGFNVGCIPGEEYGDYFFNAVSMSNGQGMFFEDSQEIYVYD